MARPGGETPEHRELKRLALIWAQAHGFRVAACEARLPRCGFRADVAACAVPAGRIAVAGETAVFECKQARSDLLRDVAAERETSERLRAVMQRRRELESMLGLHLPSLRRGETLFAECDAYDLDAIRHDGLRAVRREEAVLQARLHGGTKLARLHRYGCADRLYLVVEPGVLEPHEVPEGWGLLVRECGGLRLERRPEYAATDAAARLAMLQAVARAAARAVNAACGVDPAAVIEVRRREVAE